MRAILCLAAVGALALAGCGDDTARENSTVANSTETASAGAPAEAALGTVLAGESSLGRLNRIVGGAGMTELLNGVGPYTLFAPTDQALEGLGQGRADALANQQMRPQAVALIRAHIVPGTLTRRDLEAAIADAGGKPVQMRTMADTMLTFTREGDAIIVSSDRGGRGRIGGEERLASNGAIHPIDGVLLRAE
jgi:uncharacterized surface protein with fasciclin (FAS1) repeats